MQLIKFPLSDTTGKEISLPNDPKLTDNVENVITSLPYQSWEIDEVIEKLSEDEQDALIEKISALVESWELMLDVELEALLQRRYKESKTSSSLNYVDWLYDLAQEEIYRAYAIGKLDKQKNIVVSLTTVNVETNQTSTNLNSPISIISTNRFSTINESAKTIAPATPTDLSANQTANNLNCLLNDEEQQINQIIENLSEDEQDALMEKTALLLDEWESTRDAGLELALRTQHQKHQSHISYQDFLYELAQSQVYREYAIEQLELVKQSTSFGLIEPFTQIEKVYCNKATNVDEPTFDELNIDEPIFDGASQDTNNVGVQLLDANNNTIINDELTTNDNSDTFIREESFSNKISLDHYQVNVGDNQGYQEILTSLKDCASHHITKTSPNGYRKLTTKYNNQQSSNVSSANYSWKDLLPLTKTRKALLIPSYFGKHTSIHHPPSLPP